MKITWATNVRAGIMVGDLHAWRRGAPRSACGRMARGERVRRPNFAQERAAQIGCPSCIKVMSKGGEQL